MVGMARPFYAEPRLGGARLLEGESEAEDEARVLCERAATIVRYRR